MSAGAETLPPCTDCGGSGRRSGAPALKCASCRGDGRQLPHGAARCPRCDGDAACRFCDGSGIVGDAACWTHAHPAGAES